MLYRDMAVMAAACSIIISITFCQPSVFTSTPACAATPWNPPLHPSFQTADALACRDVVNPWLHGVHGEGLVCDEAKGGLPAITPHIVACRGPPTPQPALQDLHVCTFLAKPCCKCRGCCTGAHVMQA